MALPSARNLSVIPSLHPNRSIIALLFFSVIIFFAGLGDAVMSYFSPVFIESHLNNSFLMGLIISSSSLVGLASDIIFGAWFKGKSFSFFLSWGIFFAVLFPLIYLLFPAIPAVFLLAMASWGIYYEFIAFSKFHFINHFLEHRQHDTGWAILTIFNDLAYLLGPLIAGVLISQHASIPLLSAVSVQVIAAAGLVIFLQFFRQRLTHHHSHPEKVSQLKQLQIWVILLKKVWPISLFIFSLTLIDATFWTVGAVLAEELKEIHPFGGLLLGAYMLPGLFMSLIAPRLSKPLGKKRTSFIAGAAAGLLYIIAGVSHSTDIFIGLVLLSATFGAISLPEILGTLEDYLERLGQKANYLVSLENATISSAYIIGPIAAGAIASIVGPRLTFSLMGLLLAAVSILALSVTPRKISMPQNSLKKL